MTRVPLPDLSSRAWEHPADRGALVALRKLRGFDTLVRKMSSFLSERAVRMQLLGSAVRCDIQQYNRVYLRLLEVAAGLDAQQLPEIYVTNSPVMNAMTVGVDKPVIVLNSALVQQLDDDELRFVIGHELGHALSGHALYRTMAFLMVQLSARFQIIPIAGWGLRAIVAGLLEWQRKSELSADRAGLLATQDVQAAIRALQKLAGNGTADDLNTEAFLRQAHEYQSTDDARDVILRTLFVINQDHPFAVVRAAELDSWVASGAYQQILDGQYPRRSDDANATMTEEAQAAASSYSTTFSQIDDFLGGLPRQVGDAATEAKDFIAGIFKPRA